MKNKKMVEKKAFRQDLAVLISLPVLAAIVAWTFKLDFLITNLLYLGSPILYLLAKNPGSLKRNLIFSTCFTVAGVYADYMAERDLAWAAPHSVFSFRIGGIVPLENVEWFFLLTLLVIAFYERFFDHSRHADIGKHMKLLFSLVIIATVAFFVPLLAHVEYPTISYFYLKLGIFMGLLPLSTFLFEFPRFLSIFLKTAPYFAALCLLEEFVGLHNGHWVFPGHHFIGWVQLASYRLPYEELIFWMVMFSSIVIAYFEFFDDNRLKLKLRRR